MGKPKLMIATPCHHSFPKEYVESLLGTWFALKDRFDVKVQFVDSPLVYSNRNQLFARAYQDDVDYMLCVDSDMDWDVESFNKLYQLDKDMAIGVCLSRKPMIDKEHFPVVFWKVGDEMRAMNKVPAEPFQADACGMAFVLLKKSVIKKLTDMIGELGLPFDPLKGVDINVRQVGSSGLVGEDLSFCYRVKKAGFEIWCHPDVKVGHLVTFSLGKS